MTYIVAWKDKKNVFITGDSAITRRGVSEDYIEEIVQNSNRLKSTFGESIVIDEDIVIQESVLKIHSINNRLLIGYAGTGDPAVDVINTIKEEIKDDLSNIESIILDASQRLGWSFEMICGYIFEGVPKLITFNINNNGAIEEHDSLAWLGGLKKDLLLKRITEEVISEFKTGRLKNYPVKQLLTFCSLLQSFILRGEFLQLGVGGFYTGAYLNEKGVTWNQDTTYITFRITKVLPQDHDYNPNVVFSDSKMVSLLHRGSFAAILSIYPNRNYRDIAVFRNYIHSGDLKFRHDIFEQEFNRWKTKYQKEIIRRIRKFDSRFFVFICTDRNTPDKISFIENYCNSSRLLISLKWEKWIPVINVSKGFIQEIYPYNSSMPIQFHWLTKRSILWYVKMTFLKICKQMIESRKSYDNR